MNKVHVAATELQQLLKQNTNIIGATTAQSRCQALCSLSKMKTRMWANAQRDGRPAEHRWRPLFNAAKFG